MTSKLKTDVLETVSGSGTIALTNQLSGMTSASVPSGSVLQVVSAVEQTLRSTTASVTSAYVDSGFGFSITPTSASSKVLVSISLQGSADGGTYATYRLYRSIGGVDTYISAASSTISVTANGTAGSGFLTTHYIPIDTHEVNTVQHMSGSYLDSPNTTSNTTYKIFYASRPNSTAYINRASDGTTGDHNSHGVSTITLMEIKG